MKVLDPVGVKLRDPHPTARRAVHRPLTSAGPNEIWCCDGHDKLLSYGFSVWGIRDKYSRKWLGLWCLPAPSNRYPIVVAYLWLSVVQKLGGESHLYKLSRLTFPKGMPAQTSTDCGSETLVIHGLANALK